MIIHTQEAFKPRRNRRESLRSPTSGSGMKISMSFSIIICYSRLAYSEIGGAAWRFRVCVERQFKWSVRPAVRERVETLQPFTRLVCLYVFVWTRWWWFCMTETCRIVFICNWDLLQLRCTLVSHQFKHGRNLTGKTGGGGDRSWVLGIRNFNLGRSKLERWEDWFEP